MKVKFIVAWVRIFKMSGFLLGTSPPPPFVISYGPSAYIKTHEIKKSLPFNKLCCVFLKPLPFCIKISADVWQRIRRLFFLFPSPFVLRYSPLAGTLFCPIMAPFVSLPL